MPVDKPAAPGQKRIGFKIGLLLLLLNGPFGIGGMILGALLAATTGRKGWLVVGAGAYAASWGMFAFGVLLCGKEGLKYFRELRLRLFGKRANENEAPTSNTTPSK